MSYKLIQTRSPFFVKLDTTEDVVELGLKIWSGSVSGNIPSDNQYTLSKEVSQGGATFEIAELIRDFIRHTTATTSGTVWVQTTLDDGAATPTVETYLAAEGYTLSTEGIQHSDNQTTLDQVLLPQDSNGDYRIMMPKDGVAIIPVFINVTNTTDWHYSINGNTPVVFSSSAQSTGMIRYVISTESGIVNLELGSTKARVYVDELECRKYDSNQLLYVNKLGAKVYFPFNLKHIEKYKQKDKTYVRSLVNYADLSDHSSLHSRQRIVTETKQMFTLNTDWINEYYTAQLEELFFSEYVWLQRPTGNAQPVIITTNNLIKKTHINDNLINYTIEVEASDEYINTIR